MAYCNTTTDLTDVFPRLNDLQLRDEIENWTATSGQSLTWEKFGTGDVYNLFEDGLSLTVKTSIAEVEATAATYWYDSDNDLLYCHPTGDGDPEDFTLEIGEDWDTFKTDCNKDAMGLMDGWLNKKFTTPLLARDNKDHSTDDYEFPIKRACAALTIYFIMNRRDPGNSDALDLYKIAWNKVDDDDDTDEVKGIINMYLENDLVRQESVSPREAGNYNVFPDASNTTAELGIELEGNYTGSTFQMWRVTITTGGAPDGTMIWKFSDDDGTTDTRTSITSKTSGSSNLFESLSGSIKIRFPAATYTKDDYWQIQVYPMDSTLAAGGKIGSIALCR